MEQKHHWRTGGKITNAGCEMLPDGKDIPSIIIEKIEYKDEHVINGRKERGIWIATFAPNPYTNLPMILNATNRKRLVKMFGTEYLDTLKNIAVRLTKEKCRDVQDGGETWGLRIHKNKIPQPSAAPAPNPAPAPAAVAQSKPKPILTPAHKKWQDAINQVRMGNYTIEQLRELFIISEETEAQIMAAIAEGQEDLPDGQ